MKEPNKHERIAEARHNELVAIINGVIGGILVGVGAALVLMTDAGSIGFLVFIIGSIMLVAGLFAQSHHREKRKKLLKETEEDKHKQV